MSNSNWKSLILKNHFLLSPSEQVVANLLLNDEVNPLSHSISFVAKVANVAPSLVNRMCQKIGVSGWKALCGIVSTEFSQGPNIFKNKSEIFDENYFYLQNYILQKEKYIMSVLKKLVDEIHKASRIMVLANGSTYYIAQSLAEKLQKAGLNVFVYDLNITGIIFHRRDLVLFLSVSGRIDFLQPNLQAIIKTSRVSLVTFGNQSNLISGTQLCLGISSKFPAREKPFPTYTDSLFLKIINILVEQYLLRFEKETDLLKSLHKKQL